MWMPRQEVRGLARDKGVGDTGLLDHVLKSIGHQLVMLVKQDAHKKAAAAAAAAAAAKSPAAGAGAGVRAKITRRQNNSSGQLEYKLESVAGIAGMRAHIVMGKEKAAGKGKKSEAKAGGSLRTSTRPTLNLLLLLRAYVCAFTLMVSHARSRFAMTLLPG